MQDDAIYLLTSAVVEASFNQPTFSAEKCGIIPNKPTTSFINSSLIASIAKPRKVKAYIPTFQLCQRLRSMIAAAAFFLRLRLSFGLHQRILRLTICLQYFQLLDCFSIPTVLILSWSVLRARYRLTHIGGMALGLMSVVVLVWSDVQDGKGGVSSSGGAVVIFPT